MGGRARPLQAEALQLEGGGDVSQLTPFTLPIALETDAIG
jgi:hypothetical protein